MQRITSVIHFSWSRLTWRNSSLVEIILFSVFLQKVELREPETSKDDHLRKNRLKDKIFQYDKAFGPDSKQVRFDAMNYSLLTQR